MSKVLFLFTNKYPFDKGEEFLKEELNQISKYFNKIYIIPVLAKENMNKRKIPENCEIIDFEPLKKIQSQFRKNNFIKRAIIFKKKELFNLFKQELKFGLKFVKISKIFTFIDKILFSIYYGYNIYLEVRNYIYEKIKNYDSAIIYSYWTNFSAVSLIFIKNEIGLNKEIYNNNYSIKNKNVNNQVLLNNLKFKNIKFITRMHGFDLYNFRTKINYQVFQFYLIKNIVDKSFLNCYAGLNHLINYYRKIKNSYKLLKEKLKVAYLGINIKKFNLNFLEKLIEEYKIPIKKNALIVVSCSYFTPVKRLHLIPEIIFSIDFNIQWYHIGSGNESYKKIIETKINNLKKRVGRKFEQKVIFKGYMQNDQIFELYKELKPDLYINLSTSEGVPVAIMEAQFMGIPALVTDAGGNTEIIKEGFNGFIVSKEKPINDSIIKIKKFLSLPQDKITLLKKNSHSYVLEKFSSQKNFNNFAQMILGLIK